MERGKNEDVLAQQHALFCFVTLDTTCKRSSMSSYNNRLKDIGKTNMTMKITRTQVNIKQADIFEHTS
jgi:hypothetical protein